MLYHQILLKNGNPDGTRLTSLTRARQVAWSQRVLEGLKKTLVFWLFEEKLLITRNEDNQIVYGTRDCALQTGIGRLKLNGG